MNPANPRDYVSSLTADETLVYKYEGGEIHFRTYLTVGDIESLPPAFFLGTKIMQNVVLFQMTACNNSGQPLYPRKAGFENEAMNAAVEQEYLQLNGAAVNKIAVEVDLWNVIMPQLAPNADIDEPVDPRQKEATPEEKKPD